LQVIERESKAHQAPLQQAMQEIGATVAVPAAAPVPPTPAIHVSETAKLPTETHHSAAVSAAAAAAVQSQAPATPEKTDPAAGSLLAVPGSGDKKHKTLSRTRQYVNEAGETVTVTTQRIVETAMASGRAMTIRKGMQNLEQDWQMDEHHKMALLRKLQVGACWCYVNLTTDVFLKRFVRQS
jgi:hypothetical protein